MVLGIEAARGWPPGLTLLCGNAGSGDGRYRAAELRSWGYGESAYMTMRGSVMLAEIWGSVVTQEEITHALVGQDGGAVDVQLVLDADVVTQDGNVLDTALALAFGEWLIAYPTADGAVPSDNGAGNPGVVADVGVGENDAALETDTLADLSARANDNVGTDNGGGVDLGGLDRSATIHQTSQL